MRVFSNMTTCLPPPLPPPIAVFSSFWHDSRPPHIISDAKNVQFALFRAVGAARGAKMRPIKNREGRGTLAFECRHLNNKFINQPKVGAISGENIWEGGRLWQNVWGGAFSHHLRRLIGQRNKHKNKIHRDLQRRPTTKNTQQSPKNTPAQQRGGG